MPGKKAIWRELFAVQLPSFVGLLALGYTTAYVQYGFVPGGSAPFPQAGVAVPVWHLVWMGLWTGYTLALVGQAAGIFALPYNTSILRFDNPHVTPTMLILTLINPIGALLGFRRSGQWNLDFAAAVCLGGAVGGLLGPVLRVTLLGSPENFRLVLGLALAAFGAHLCAAASGLRSSGRDVLASSGPSETPSSLIMTMQRSLSHIVIKFGEQRRTLSNPKLFLLGVLVGVISSALGVGGAFLLVPILGSAYRLPVYVIVAATIPYSIVLSAAGVLTFTTLLPVLGEPAVAPEWSWAFFTAAGGLLGAWAGSKVQMDIPENVLGWMLGGVTIAAGAAYVIGSLCNCLPR